MDFLALADNLAARYAPGTLTGPVGYPALRVSTARLPNNIPTSPWVLVMPPNGEIIVGGATMDGEHVFHVQFHYAKASADLARDTTAMLAWLGPLLSATFAATLLGLGPGTGYVKSAFPEAYRFAIFTYGGDEYYGWEIDVHVITRDEPVTLVMA